MREGEKKKGAREGNFFFGEFEGEGGSPEKVPVGGNEM